MKKYISFTLFILLFSLHNLMAMESENKTYYPNDILPPEIDCQIMELVPQQPVSVKRHLPLLKNIPTPNNAPLPRGCTGRIKHHAHSITWSPTSEQIAMYGHEGEHCQAATVEEFLSKDFAWSKDGSRHIVPEGAHQIINFKSSNQTRQSRGWANWQTAVLTGCFTPDDKYEIAIDRENKLRFNKNGRAGKSLQLNHPVKSLTCSDQMTALSGITTIINKEACITFYDHKSIINANGPAFVIPKYIERMPDDPEFYEIRFSPNGKCLAAVGNNPKLYIFDLTKGTNQFRFTEDKHNNVPLRTVDWHPNGTCVAVGSSSGRIFICNPENSQILLQYDHPSDIASVRWSPCGKFIASCEHNTTLIIKDAMAILLGTHQLEKCNFAQYDLLQRIKHKLLKRETHNSVLSSLKNALDQYKLIIGEHDHKTLDNFPEKLKKLLTIEHNTAPTKLWRLSLKQTKPIP